MTTLLDLMAVQLLTRVCIPIFTSLVILENGDEINLLPYGI